MLRRQSAKLKMTNPKYQDVRSAQIAETEQADGSKIRIITGQVGDLSGPVTGIAAEPLYMDVVVPSSSKFTFPVERDHNSFSYVFEGKGKFGVEQAEISATALVVWGDGDEIQVITDKSAVRFLLVAGKPLNESVARYGPFVMNTKEEIDQALQDLRRGTFVR